MRVLPWMTFHVKTHLLFSLSVSTHCHKNLIALAVLCKRQIWTSSFVREYCCEKSRCWLSYKIRWSLKSRELCSCNTTNWCTMIVTLLYFVLFRSAVVEGVSTVYFLMFESSKNWTKCFTVQWSVSTGYMRLIDMIVVALTELNEKVGLKIRFE